jgi:Icc protein
MMDGTHPATRREFLQATVGAMALGLTDGDAAQPGDFSFIVVNDTHYIDSSCREFHQRVVREMRASAPDLKFCLFAGDLTDLGGKREMQDFAGIYAGLKCPLRAVPGNHDCFMEGEEGGFDEVFPGQRNHWFEFGGWQFVGIDTTEGALYMGTSISHRTLDWVEHTLRRGNGEALSFDPAKPTFVFTHFPLAEQAEFRPVNAPALLEQLAKASVRWVHSGHWHAESAHRAGAMTLTTSRCCARLRENRDGSPMKGWHVYTVAGSSLSRHFVGLTDG